MTLILGMSKPEGIYLSVDYRVIDSKTKQLIDDTSVKFLVAHYPPDQVGPKALFAYTGIAELPDGTRVGNWLRETLRGEGDTFNASMKHLLQRLCLGSLASGPANKGMNHNQSATSGIQVDQ